MATAEDRDNSGDAGLLVRFPYKGLDDQVVTVTVRPIRVYWADSTWGGPSRWVLCVWDHDLKMYRDLVLTDIVGPVVKA